MPDLWLIFKDISVKAEQSSQANSSMALLTYRNLSVSYGGPMLLDDTGIIIDKKERICLLGRNGEGKSTLLRILSGQVNADKGEFERQPDLRIAKLDQEIPAGLSGSVFEVVAEGLGEKGDLLRKYNAAVRKLAESPQGENASLLVDQLQEQLDQSDGWDLDHRVASVIDRVGLKPDESFDSQSGGNKSRAMLARALVAEPHLLILDEPTNGLDPNQIRQSRELIKHLGERHTILISTHILSEVEMTCGRVVIIDRGKIKASDTPQNLIRRLRRPGEIILEMKGDAESVEKKLVKLDGVENVTSSQAYGGWSVFNLKTDPNIDVREDVFSLVQSSGWKIRELASRAASLEDAFVDLVSNSDEQAKSNVEETEEITS